MSIGTYVVVKPIHVAGNYIGTTQDGMELVVLDGDDFLTVWFPGEVRRSWRFWRRLP